MNWGDSTTEFIASNAAPGGVGGATEQFTPIIMHQKQTQHIMSIYN